MTTFKNDKFLKSIKTEARGVKINCNAVAISTNKRGKYGNLKVWYLPDVTPTSFRCTSLNCYIELSTTAGWDTTTYTCQREKCGFIKTNKASRTWTLRGQTKLELCSLCSTEGETVMRTRESP